MRLNPINQATQRPDTGSCFAHGYGLDAKVWPLSGRTTE